MADAVFLQDGQRFVLRGYVSGWLYSGFGATPVRFDMPLKGESVTTDWSPGAIFVGSENAVLHDLAGHAPVARTPGSPARP